MRSFRTWTRNGDDTEQSIAWMAVAENAQNPTVQATATAPVSSVSTSWHNTVVAVASAAASGLPDLTLDA